MSKTQVIGDMSAWAGMMKDFWRQVGDGSLTERMFSDFLQHRDPFRITDIGDEWEEFYRKYFRLSVNLYGVTIALNPGGFDRVIFVPKGLKLNDVLKAIRKQFPAWSYVDDLDNDVVDNVRTTDRSYAIRLRERVEADEELKNLSANQLRKQGVNCMTLLERLVYELKYFSETGQHLDVSNITLCAGSRSRLGRVPGVDWDAVLSELHISWYHPDYAVDFVRARQTVS
ncbi:MAG: hypothetical protein WC465_04460 [Patescibacteria group bacterium]